MEPSRPRSPQEEELLIEQNLCFLRDAFEEMEKEVEALTRMGSYGHWALRTVFANGERVRMVSKPHRGAALIFGQLLEDVAVGFPLKLFPGPRRPPRWPTADARPSVGPQDTHSLHRRRAGGPWAYPAVSRLFPAQPAARLGQGDPGPLDPAPRLVQGRQQDLPLQVEQRVVTLPPAHQLLGRARSRVEGDSHSTANKLQQHRTGLPPQGQRQPLKARRRVGPPRAAEIALRAETGGGAADLPCSASEVRSALPHEPIRLRARVASSFGFRAKP
jgi:hypothetical protein